METVKNHCLNLNVKRDHAVDEPIIPSKTKYTKIRQYNPKKPCKWGFKNIVRAGKSGFMYDFYLYCGKEDRPPADYDHLSGSAQSVAWYVLIYKDMLANMSSLITGLRPLICYST